MTSAATSRFSSRYFSLSSRLCAHVTLRAMPRKAVATAWALRRSFPMYRIFMQSGEAAERCVNCLSAGSRSHYTEQFERASIETKRDGACAAPSLEWPPNDATLASLRRFENRGGAAADRRTNQCAFLASDDAADTGAAGRRSADD